MKTYELLLLRFRTPVHFGDAGEGGGLGDVIPYCRADTFFSALCSEAAKIDSAMLKKLVEKAENGDILFTDLMPWFSSENGSDGNKEDKNEGNYAFYIPRPLVNVSSEKVEKPLSFSETKQFSTLRKELKKRAYIRASQCGAYLEDMKKGAQTVDPEPEFGKFVLSTHYNSRTKAPYDIGKFYFKDNAGLYLIIEAEDGNDFVWLETLIRLTGLNGIGGRKSGGNGKFELEDDPVLLSEDAVYGEDDPALYAMLENENADVQMALCSVLPAAEEMIIAHEGSGKLVKRSGFAYSAETGKPIKENSIFMMTAGSCFKKRLAGTIADVNNGISPHPVYRYGKGIYVGLIL